MPIAVAAVSRNRQKIDETLEVHLTSFFLLELKRAQNVRAEAQLCR